MWKKIYCSLLKKRRCTFSLAAIESLYPKLLLECTLMLIKTSILFYLLTLKAIVLGNMLKTQCLTVCSGILAHISEQLATVESAISDAIANTKLVCTI